MTLVEVIICYIKWAVMTVWSYGVDAFKAILSVFVAGINLALSVLPQMTLPDPDLSGSWVGLLNYVINIGVLLDATGLLIGMTLLWKLYKWLLKFVQ